MDIQPHRPQGGMNPGRPNPGMARPLMSDFAPRRPAVAPQPPASRPLPSTSPVTNTSQPTQQIGANLTATPKPAQPPALSPAPTAQPTAIAPPQQRTTDTLPDMSSFKTETNPEPQPVRRGFRINYGALIGFGVFVALAILFVSPVVPGKVLDNFPGSSATASSGAQSLACIDEVKNMASSTTYTTKLGSPLVYKYATSTVLKGTCNGTAQTTVGGTTSLFSPLALTLNLLLAGVIGIIVGKLCGKFLFKHQV